ncbi:MAG: putative hydroxymethylpyrimidine transporter CytX [Clostridia bacterium]|nr:putative hydroxymethylpyrimidine transporter CytX [Clostridia bacterium]
MKNKTSTISNAMIWFGAGVSLAEILTGTLIAPLGFAKGFAAILLGHLIGCVLLFFAGWIGARTGKSAMETVSISFGKTGSKFFAGLNVLQLIGWTGVMIVSGATAAQAIVNLGGQWVWSLMIGALIAIWVLIDIKNLEKVNFVAMGGLFLLTCVLSVVVFRGGATAVNQGTITFGAAVELSVAMPLSWLPLIADYTRTAKKPFVATIASSVTYFLVSVWMYVIGMGAALFTGESDVAQIMLKAGLGIPALLIVIFSTVTTTFLDVYSAGVSSESIWAKLREKPAALAVCMLGTMLAIFTLVTELEGFLYLIGSVFAPMIAILVTDDLILRRDSTEKKIDKVNFFVWLIGFVLYRLSMYADTPVGYTLPVMVVTGILCVLARKVCK